MFNECFYLFKIVVLSFLLVPRMPRHLSLATTVQLRVPIGILDFEEIGAGLETGLIR